MKLSFFDRGVTYQRVTPMPQRTDNTPVPAEVRIMHVTITGDEQVRIEAGNVRYWVSLDRHGNPQLKMVTRPPDPLRVMVDRLFDF